MSQSSISADCDMMLDALILLSEWYPEAKENVPYMNKALYENTFIMNKKERVLVRKYKKKDGTKTNHIRCEVGYYFLDKLHYTKRLIKHGVCRLYYKNGQIEKEYTYFHGKIHGLMLTYAPAGNLESSEMYDNGRLHGKYYKYCQGDLLIERNYSHGLRHGEYKAYDDYGLSAHGYYVDGKQHGKYQEWNDSYETKLEHYKHGVLHGECRHWYMNSFTEEHEVIDILNYVDGKKHGMNSEFNRDGYTQQNYHEGKLQGLTTVWSYKFREYDDYKQNPIGKYIERQENYENGNLHGVYRSFYDNGQIEVETNYEHGKLHGVCKNFSKYGGRVVLETNYENGVKVSNV